MDERESCLYHSLASSASPFLLLHASRFLALHSCHTGIRHVCLDTYAWSSRVSTNARICGAHAPANRDLAPSLELSAPPDRVGATAICCYICVLVLLLYVSSYYGYAAICACTTLASAACCRAVCVCCRMLPYANAICACAKTLTSAACCRAVFERISMLCRTRAPNLFSRASARATLQGLPLFFSSSAPLLAPHTHTCPGMMLIVGY